MREALRGMIHAAAELDRELTASRYGLTRMGGVLRALCVMAVDACECVLARFDAEGE